MADKSTEQRVKDIIVEQLGVNADQVTPEAKFIEDLGADSLDTVELVMAFEEEFGVEIPDSAAEKIRSVGDVASFVWQAKRDAGDKTAEVEEIVEQIRAITADQLGVDPETIFPWTRFVEDLGAD